MEVTKIYECDLV